MQKGIRLAQVFGIDLTLDPSWFIIFAFMVWSLTGHYLMVYSGWSFGARLALAVTTALLFFASVIGHELGHSLVARRLGVPVRRIILFVFGGVAELSREPRRPRDELLIALAGPAVSLALWLGFGLVRSLGASLGSAGLEALGAWLTTINLSLALFNLIPGFPLDGGRALRALVWWRSGDLPGATRLAANLGRAIAWGFVAVGIWQGLTGAWVNGLWFALIGWFLANAATSSLTQAKLEARLEGRTARDVMLTDCPNVPPETSLERLVEAEILPGRGRCFPVTGAHGLLLGMVNADQVQGVPRERWALTSVAEVMTPVERLPKTHADAPLTEVLARLRADERSELPVTDADGRWVGTLRHEDLLELAHSRSEAGGEFQRAAR